MNVIKQDPLEEVLERKLVPNREYARLIGVTPRTLFNYVKRGVLPPPRVIGGRNFWDPQVLPRGDAPKGG